MTFAVLFLGIVVVLVVPYAAALLGNWINVDTLDLLDDTQVDAIIILGGKTLERAFTGVDLYRQGAAPQVAITGHNSNEPEPEFDETLAARDYAIQQGVPEQNLTLLSSTSTFEDAKEIASYASQIGAQQLVVVSDWTHGRRAVCSIRAATTSRSPAVFFVATPSDFTPTNWWLSKDGTESIFKEVAKMVFYMLRYGIPMWGCFPGDPNLLTYLGGFAASISLVFLSAIWIRRNTYRFRHLAKIKLPTQP